MTLGIPRRTVVFDYGEVISRSPSEADREGILEVAGVHPGPFWASYDRHRDALDRGDLGVVDYWAAIAHDTGAIWSVSRVNDLWSRDFRGWLTPEPATVEIVNELREGGTRLAVLSNAGLDFAGPLRHSPLGRLFERVFISAEMNDLKPEPSIYETVLRELAITPAETVFIDNKRVNVDAAEALGITGHVFVGPSELREFLVTLAE